MSEEVFIALNDLTNGALNYYQAIETVMVRKQVIKNYIKQLQQENKHLKDLQKNMDKQYEELEQENYTANKTINELSNQIAKLFEDKKQLKDNWNKLKEFAQEKIDNPSWASCGARYVLEKMQELESSDINE